MHDSNDHGYRGNRDSRGDNRRRKGTPLADLDPELTDVSRRVIGCAIDVHRALGPGFERSVYIEALKMEFDLDEVGFDLDHEFDIMYKDQKIGETIADMFIDNRFLLSLKARPGEIGSAERNELRAQLRAADLELGLIINFSERRLKDGLVRVLNPDKLNAVREEAEESEEYEEAHEMTEHPEPFA